MKIKFTKLPTTDGIIKISLDGGDSFKDYNIADIHESGIPLEDNQDYEKIQIQAPANILKNLNVVSSVKVEGGEGGESGVSYTFEKDIFEEREVTYYCFAPDDDGNGEIEDNELHRNVPIWVKEPTPNAKLEPFLNYELSPGILDTSDSLVSAYTIYPREEYFIKLNDDKSVLFSGRINEDGEEEMDTVTCLRYLEGDLTGTSLVKVGTETVTEIITEIQDEPTITENGQTVADEGKAFKSVNVFGNTTIYAYTYTGAKGESHYVYSDVPTLRNGDTFIEIDYDYYFASVSTFNENNEYPDLKCIGVITLFEFAQEFGKVVDRYRPK